MESCLIGTHTTSSYIDIHQDFSVNIDKVTEEFVFAKTRTADFGQFLVNTVPH